MTSNKYRLRALTATGLMTALALSACAPTSPYQEARRQQAISCTAGTVGGAVLGGAVGNQFGGGRGRDILTAGGAAGGAIAGSRYAC